MSRPQNDHAAIREQLMEAAEEMVRARGAINLSLSEVAAACNMSQSSFYRYFASKEAFFEAIAGRWFGAASAMRTSASSTARLRLAAALSKSSSTDM